MRNMKYILYFAWAVALFATLGSLYFSEVLKLTPCVLCWYQRVCVYPLVLILAVGILRKDRNIFYYVLPLSITGMIIAIYHNILYYNVFSGNNLLCTTGVSCTNKYIEYFGFITIPLLSLIALALITLSMFVYAKICTKS